MQEMDDKTAEQSKNIYMEKEYKNLKVKIGIN